MMLPLGFLLAGTLAVSAGDEQPPAAPPDAPAPAVIPEGREADVKAIQQAVKSFVDAFNAGDIEKVMATFAEDAEVVDEDNSFVIGRDEIAQRFAATFEKSPGAKLAIEPERLRFLSGDVAVERGRATLTPEESNTLPYRSRYTVVYVKKDGAWLHSLVRDESPSGEDELKALEWMLGEWIEEGPDVVLKANCKWAPGKKFLLREFELAVGDEVVLSGTQRIGWDPLTKQLKSWVFDSNGGHGEGAWARDGNRWVVRATGVLPDGRLSAATQVFTAIDANTLRFDILDRTVGGEVEGEDESFVLVRKPPAPGEAGAAPKAAAGEGQAPQPASETGR